MTEIKTKIPAEMEPAAVGGMVTDSKYIIDRVKNKNQTEVNAETDASINQLSNEIDAVNTQDIVPVDSLPAVGSADPRKIYRVVGETSYTDNMVNAAGDGWKVLAVYTFPGIDDEPTAGSENLVKSGGVEKEYAYHDVIISDNLVDDYVLRNGYIDAQNAFALSTIGKGILKAINAGDIVATTGSGLYIAFTKNNIYEDLSVQFSEETGFTERVYLTSTTPKTAPSDAKYLWVYAVNGSGVAQDYVHVTVNGKPLSYPIIKGMQSELVSCFKQVPVLSKETALLYKDIVLPFKSTELQSTSSQNGILLNDGSIIADSYVTIKTFNITNKQKLLISGRQTPRTDVSLACIYDAKGKMLANYQMELGESYTNLLIFVPESAATIKVASNETLKAIKVFDVQFTDTLTFLSERRTGDVIKKDLIQNLNKSYVFNVVNSISSSDDESNHVLVANGQTIQYTNYVTSTFDVTGQSYVAITGRQYSYNDNGTFESDTVIACAYDSNGNILCSYQLEKATNYKDYLIPLPFGAVTLKVSSNTNHSDVYPAAVKTVSNIIERASAMTLVYNKNIVKLLNQSFVPILGNEVVSSASESGCLLTNGSLKTNASGYTTFSFEVENAEYVAISGRQWNYGVDNLIDTAIVCAYNESGMLLNSYQLDAGTNYFDYIIPIPFGTKIVKVSSNASSGNAKLKNITGLSYENTEVPLYWKSYLEEKIEDINEKVWAIGNTGDNFIFLTDFHLENNYGKSPVLIKEILSNTSIKKLFIGGDMISSAETFEEAAGKIQQAYNMLNVTNSLYAVRGNHDNTNGVTSAVFYSIFDRPLEESNDNMNGKVYFYKDNVPQKIRYIFVDDPVIDSAISNEKVEFIQQAILGVSSGWTVILIAHTYWNGVAVGAEPTVSAAGQSVKAAIDAVYDNCPGTVAALITGHTHASRNVLTDKGYQIISTPADCYSWNYDEDTPNRTQRTTNEQVFDVFNIDTSAKKIYITRIGGGGSDRELTYQ